MTKSPTLMDTFHTNLPGRCSTFTKEIQSDPYNYRAWNSLLAEINTHSNLNHSIATQIFELALHYFPEEGKFWHFYASYEYHNSNFSHLEEIFTKALPTSINSIDLWRLYLKYVCKTSKVQEGDEVDVQKEKKETIVGAFEAALTSVGCSPFSGPLWQDYIDYAQRMHVGSFFEEQQKMELLRRIFSRAILIPTASVESIWKEYDAFENSLNKLTARKILGDKSAQYMLARSVYKEMSMILDGIHLNELPAPPTSELYNPEELRVQFNAWNRLFEWENKNPLLIENSDILHSRMMFWYRMAVVYLKYNQHIWFSAANYLISKKRLDEVPQFFGEASAALPESLLICFSHAEFEENNGQLETSKQIYEKMLDTLTTKINKYIETNSLQDECLKDDQEFEKDSSQFDQILSYHPLLNQHIQSINLTYINYMRFSRRTEGIKGSRLVFTNARKTFFCSSHIFIAAALMEFYCSKDSSISIKIFELGMKRFAHNPLFIIEYLKFLIILNDDINTRSLFERAIVIQPKNREFWELYLDFLCKYGDCTDVQKRFEQIFPVQPKDSAAFYAKKFQFLDIPFEQEDGGLKEGNGRGELSVGVDAELFLSNPVSYLLQLLPLPNRYHGPVIKPEELIDLINNTVLPKRVAFKKYRDTSDDEGTQLGTTQERTKMGGQSGEPKQDLFSARHQQKRRRRN